MDQGELVETNVPPEKACEYMSRYVTWLVYVHVSREVYYEDIGV